MPSPSPTSRHPDPSPITHTPAVPPPSPTPHCPHRPTTTPTLAVPPPSPTSRDPPPVAPPPSPTPRDPHYHSATALTHLYLLYRSPHASPFIFFPSDSQNSLNIKEREREAPLPLVDGNGGSREFDGSDGGSRRWWKPAPDGDGDAVVDGKRGGRARRGRGFRGKDYEALREGKQRQLDL
uniref:Probable pathogenesis-related protein ARB_02861 n=1 Tax=Elaeis guineensis var. tenera TaxID=51953 RepID=A0A6I9R0J3_ELAGV|nr:probable pathogenesis-related protein ARB_02861 [Elaeis guineensis]